MSGIRRGKIGVYGEKTRRFQRRLSAELFGLSFKDANIYRYLGSRANLDPSIDDIQTKVFYEVPDRAYDQNTVNIMIGMEPMGESAMDFSRFGIINPIGDEQTFRVHMDDFEGCMGRPLILGDVMEIPFFERDCVKAFWEITDVDDKPSYEKFYYTIRAKVLTESRKTREIPIDSGNGSFLDDVMQDSDQQYNEQVPFTGLDQPTEPTQVDYHNEQQKSFLDDPSKIFNDEDNN
jgi:hypothetical protein